MNKQKKQLFLLLGILVLFIGVFVGLRAYNEAEANKEEETEGEIVMSLEYSDAEYLQYEYEGDPIDLECVDGTWYVVGDHSQNVKQYRIKSIITGIAPFIAEDKIENVTDLSIYGLTEPKKVIHVGNDVEQYTIYVGDYNNLTLNYYVYISTDPSTVYSVESAVITRFNYPLSDLVDAAEETTEESGEASVEESGGASAEESGTTNAEAEN